MEVTPKSEYRGISHYGITVDNASFYYGNYGGEFEAKVKLSGDYQVRFYQMELMIKIPEKLYQDRCGICRRQLQHQYGSH